MPNAAITLMRIIMFSTAFGILVFACTEQRTASSSDSTNLQTRLRRTWELAQVGDQNIPAPFSPSRETQPGRHPGPGTRPTISFTPEAETTLSAGQPGFLRAGGWSFCNGYGTAYALGPDGQLTFRGFHSTLVGCDGPDSLETRFFRGLASTRRFTIESDTLQLIAEDGSKLMFVPASASSH